MGEDCPKLKGCQHVSDLQRQLDAKSKALLEKDRERRYYRDKLMVESERRKTAEELLLIDPLTGAFNRNGLAKNFPEEYARVERSGNKLFMIFLDIDNFGAFNKDHGEHTGDIVLAEVVRTIEENIRPYDSIYRIGGEEFLIFLTGLRSRVIACKTAERVRKMVETLEVSPHDSTELLSVTVSLGISELERTKAEGIAPDLEQTLKDASDWANKAERKAKKRGKNRTYIYLDGKTRSVKRYLQEMGKRVRKATAAAKKKSAQERLDADLRKAAKAGEAGMVKEMLAKGADVNSANPNGWTALMWASRESKEIAGILLAAGATIDAKNDKGWTPLMIAARYGFLDIVQYLIVMGADMNTTDNENNNALAHAAMRGHVDVVELFKDVTLKGTIE